MMILVDVACEVKIKRRDGACITEDLELSDVMKAFGGQIEAIAALLPGGFERDSIEVDALFGNPVKRRAGETGSDTPIISLEWDFSVGFAFATGDPGSRASDAESRVDTMLCGLGEMLGSCGWAFAYSTGTETEVEPEYAEDAGGEYDQLEDEDFLSGRGLDPQREIA